MSRFYSEAALHVFYAKEFLHKTNAQLWKTCKKPADLFTQTQPYQEALEKQTEELPTYFESIGADGMICALDEGFPVLNPESPMGDRPFLLFYRGDVSLLCNRDKNVAVIGALDPDDSTAAREKAMVKCLVEKGLRIVSGLAKGCDTAAHEACLENGGKTIAILPTSLAKIYPAANRILADRIVEQGGLLLTEYAREALNRYESVKRFTERDRLQALFSKAVILTASHRKGQGDSGSRYAMEAAKKYGIPRYVMFDRKKDAGKSLFGLNEDLLREPDVKILLSSTIAELAAQLDNPLERLEKEDIPKQVEQLELDFGATDSNETYL